MVPKNKSIDNYRYITFSKLTRNNKPVKLSSLPPTNSATQQHLLRVYYQVQIWLGNQLNPGHWGWVMNNNVLEPTTTLLPPATDELVNMIFVTVKKGLWYLQLQHNWYQMFDYLWTLSWAVMLQFKF